MAAASLASIMDDHVALSVTCLDRLYLNGYVPTLQAPGQLVRFCREHLGKPIASPALFAPLHDGNGGRLEPSLHHHVIAPLTDLDEAHAVRGCGAPRGQRGHGAYPTATSSVV